MKTTSEYIEYVSRIATVQVLLAMDAVTGPEISRLMCSSARAAVRATGQYVRVESLQSSSARS